MCSSGAISRVELVGFCMLICLSVFVVIKLNVVGKRKHSDESDTMHHCFVIHKEHFAIVLYRVHELLCDRIVKLTSVCRFGVLG